MRRAVLLAATLGLAACAGSDRVGVTAVAPQPTVAAIKGADFAWRTKTLADDHFEGRGPGTAKGEAAADWIADDLKRIGLKPGAGGSDFQDVPAASIILDQAKSSFEVAGPDGTVKLKAGDEVAFWTPRFDKVHQEVQGSDLIFAGYGVHAPEERWDDFRGIDVKGKTLVLMINDPGFIVGNKRLFKGRAMTYYGRWTYKFEEAARRGAAAVIIIHETEPAAYGWQVVRNSNTGAKYYLDNAGGNADLAVVHSWITTDAAKALFARAGLNYAKLRLAANKRGFRAVPMTGLKLNVSAHSSVTRMKTRNVIGVVPGTAKPDEHVLYTAHWDHIGVKPDVPGADKIHNGAVDNASGVAALLEMAEAFAQKPAKRSVMFAFVTLEEQGLLGSAYLAAHPPVPLNKIVAGMNFDGVGPSGPSRDVTVVGSGASQLEDILRASLKARKRTALPDPEPEKGYFYRSDHISLAKVGVPMLYAKQGENLVEGGRAAGMALREDYRVKRYHQPADEWNDSWDLRGPVEYLELMYDVGQVIANSSDWPAWYKGNEFRAVREKSLRAK